MTTLTERRRWTRPLLLGAAAVSLVVGAAFLVSAARRFGRAQTVGTEFATHDLDRLTAADPRIVAVFNVLQREGLEASLDSLERAAAQDSALLRDGHQLAHALGRSALIASHGDASVLRKCRAAFASGCYHGVVEAFLQVHGRLDMAELEQMCGRSGDSSPGVVYECVHGLGHGVLGAVGYDVDSALRHCDALRKPSFGEWCHAGVFMEAISVAFNAPRLDRTNAHPGSHGVPPTAGHGAHDTPVAHRPSLDPADPYAPCRHFNDPYADSCWLFQGFVLLRYHGLDVAQALHTCDRAPEGRARRCYEGIGLQVTGLFQRDDAWVIEQCGKGRPDLAPYCAAGAVRALDGVDWSGTRAAGFCAISPTAWKGTCYRAAAGLLTAFASAAQRAALCANVESAYASICREAATLGDTGPGRLNPFR